FGTGFPTLAWQSANYYVDVVFTPGNAPPDTTPPVVTSRSPAPEATGVPVSTTVAAGFGEPVTGVVMTVGGVAGTTTVANGPAPSPPRAPGAANPTSSVPASGPRAGAANRRAATSWSSTPGSVSTASSSIWPPTAVPGTPSDSETAAVELGL